MIGTQRLPPSIFSGDKRVRAAKFPAMAYLWIAIGGALGSVGRYWLNGLVAARGEGIFPVGTILVNVAGSFVIGVLAAMITPGGRMVSETRTFVTQFLMIGICGGFTTFSSFSLQTLALLQKREWLYAGGNVLLSVALCLVAVWLGWLVGVGLNSMRGD